MGAGDWGFEDWRGRVVAKGDMEAAVVVAVVVAEVAEERMDMERVGLSEWCCRAVVAIAIGVA